MAVRYHSVASQLCIFLILYVYVQLQYQQYLHPVYILCALGNVGTLYSFRRHFHVINFFTNPGYQQVSDISRICYSCLYSNIDIFLQCKRIIQSHCCLCSLGHGLKFTYTVECKFVSRKITTISGYVYGSIFI